MCEIGLFAAIGFALDELQGILSKGVFINGGSIGFAMIAVIIISYRRGWWQGILTGLIMGLLDIATSAYILHPAQLLLDYILPYALVGIAGFFRPLFIRSDAKRGKVIALIIGTVVGGLAKLLSHYLAGVIFWNDPNAFAWNLNEMNVNLYCFLYNFAFIGPSIVLTGALVLAIYYRVPKILECKETYDVETDSQKALFPLVSSAGNIAIGSFLFVFFLIKYIKSFSDYQGSGTYEYDFDPDSMVIFVLGLALILIGVLSIIAFNKEKYSYIQTAAALTFVTATSFLYGLSRLIKMYVKEKDPTNYWIWVAVGTLLLAATIFFLVHSILKRKRKEN